MEHDRRLPPCRNGKRPDAVARGFADAESRPIRGREGLHARILLSSYGSGDRDLRIPTLARSAPGALKHSRKFSASRLAEPFDAGATKTDLPPPQLQARRLLAAQRAVAEPVYLDLAIGAILRNLMTSREANHRCICTIATHSWAPHGVHKRPSGQQIGCYSSSAQELSLHIRSRRFARDLFQHIPVRNSHSPSSVGL